MHSKGWLLLLALLPPAAIVVALLMHPQPEPTYAGRSLDSWIEPLTQHRGDDPEARRAIAAIATNCLPTLVRRLQYNPFPRQARMATIRRFLPKALLANQRIARIISTDQNNRRANFAFIALCVTGRAARAAVPDLRQIAINTNFPACNRAIQALVIIDRDPAPTLAAIILNPDHPGRHEALTSAWTSFDAPPGVIELLVPAVTNSNQRIACVAIDAIGELARLNLNTPIDLFIPGAELLVPTLQQASHDPREQVSQTAKDALKLLKTERLNHLPRI